MKIAEVITEVEVAPYSRGELHTEQQVVEIIQKYCSEFIRNNKNSPLYRGSRNSHAEASIISPQTGVRKSSSAIDNHYTLLMDNSPYYKGWPKRSKSLICSTDYGYASEFVGFSSEGAVSAIIPFNNSLIGVCPKEDIWSTVVDLSFILPVYRNFSDIPPLLRELGVPDSSYKDMIDYMQTPTFYQKWSEIYPDKDLNNFDLVEYLHSAMSPEKTGMQLKNSKNFVRTMFINKECWVGNSVLALSIELYNDLVGKTE